MLGIVEYFILFVLVKIYIINRNKKMKTIDLELGATLDSQKIKLGHKILEGTIKLRQEISSIKNKAKKDDVQLRE